MYAEYEQLERLEGFDSLSPEAKDFIREYCELGEIRFCDTCGSFIEGDFIWAMGFSPSRDFCCNECMEKSGYSRKDFIQDYFQTPYEGEDGYEKMMKAKAELDDAAFEDWVESRYEEDDDAPAFWTEDQLPFERNEGAPAEALDWLWKQNLFKKTT